MNPLLPIDKYLCDCEAHVFNDRLYLYGSSDVFKGDQYCLDDYHVYSCDINDLGNFKYEGVSFRKSDDINNKDSKRCMYAPDVVRGNDGKYYLYYFLDKDETVKVARSDKPQGPFKYYGEVKYCVDKNSLEDYPNSFDPAVINDNGHIYLAMGFSADFKIEGMDLNDRNTKGAYIVELKEDMLTMKTAPKFIVPGYKWGKSTSFEGHEFLEASSIRKFDDTYYFLYSSQKQHELCYCTSDNIFGPYTFQGVLISNAYENKLMNNYANNHGSIEKINDDYYIFYHRHSCGSQFSRQVCIEKLEFKDGKFLPVKITSSGIESTLKSGIYPSSIACFIYDNDQGIFLGFKKEPNDVARIEKDVICNIRKSTIVYRYLDVKSTFTINFKDEVNGEVTLIVNNEQLEKKKLEKKTSFNFTSQACSITLVFNCDKPITLSSIEII